MAMVSIAVLGYTDDTAESSTRSAHMPTGEDAFSWLDAVTVAPLSSKAAAPTKKREYGAYACCVTALAFSSKTRYTSGNSSEVSKTWYEKLLVCFFNYNEVGSLLDLKF